MNIEEILKQLEDSIKEPVLIGDDYYTGEGWETPNFFCLDPTTNDCKVLYEYITKLNNNWNELKKWLKKEHKRNINWYETLEPHDKGYYLYKFGGIGDVLDNIQDKMQELEGENNNEKESNSK